MTRLGRLGLRGLRGGAFVYCALIVVLLLLENTLLYPAPKFPLGDWEAAYFPHEDVEFASADGTRLHGWLVEHQEPQGVLLYCHGNGDCVAFLGPYLQELRDKHRLTVLAFDYRGYGKSGGTVSEAGILADGDAAQKWLAKRTGKQPRDIILMGRSLGGCVAVDLAARNGARGLILQNTTTSMPDAAANVYWFLPVKWLMRNRYESLGKIARYDGPLLQSHGDADTLIPCSLGEKLFAASPSQNKQFFCIAGGGHNDIEPAEYDAVLAKFLAELP